MVAVTTLKDAYLIGLDPLPLLYLLFLLTFNELAHPFLVFFVVKLINIDAMIFTESTFLPCSATRNLFKRDHSLLWSLLISLSFFHVRL